MHSVRLMLANASDRSKLIWRRLGNRGHGSERSDQVSRVLKGDAWDRAKHRDRDGVADASRPTVAATDLDPSAWNTSEGDRAYPRGGVPVIFRTQDRNPPIRKGDDYPPNAARAQRPSVDVDAFDEHYRVGARSPQVIDLLPESPRHHRRMKVTNGLALDARVPADDVVAGGERGSCDTHVELFERLEHGTRLAMIGGDAQRRIVRHQRRIDCASQVF